MDAEHNLAASTGPWPPCPRGNGPAPSVRGTAGSTGRRRDAASAGQVGPPGRSARALLHFGEEPVLSGLHDCAEPGPGPGRAVRGRSSSPAATSSCLFCQNYQISWLGWAGRSDDGNWPADDARPGGRGRPQHQPRLPHPRRFFPSCGPFASPTPGASTSPGLEFQRVRDASDVIERLAGIVDIYLPDLQVRPAGDPATAIPGRPIISTRARPALQEMFVQQPDLVLDADGIAAAGTDRPPSRPPRAERTTRWPSSMDGRDVSRPSIPLSLMSQYHPSTRRRRDSGGESLADEYRRAWPTAVDSGFDPSFLNRALRSGRTPRPGLPARRALPMEEVTAQRRARGRCAVWAAAPERRARAPFPGESVWATWTLSGPIRRNCFWALAEAFQLGIQVDIGRDRLFDRRPAFDNRHAQEFHDGLDQRRLEILVRVPEVAIRLLEKGFERSIEPDRGLGVEGDENVGRGVVAIRSSPDRRSRPRPATRP